MEAQGREKSCCIWRLLDGKPGHESQSLGLCEALASYTSVSRFDIPLGTKTAHLLDYFLWRFPLGDGLPAPDLIVGAGHKSHFALLAATRKFGGRSVVLMKPSLPLGWFDACIIPQHDGVVSSNVILTEGVLNAIQPQPDVSKEQTLILIGGLSEHFIWDDESIAGQVLTLVAAAPNEHFVLTTSRRTPASFLPQLEAATRDNLSLIPWQQTSSDWLPQQLAGSHSVWVSPDSVSMVYESLTSGASVGLLQLLAKQQGRVSTGVDTLVETGRVTPFDQWQQQGFLTAQAVLLNEAHRSAEWVYQQCLQND